MQEVAVSTVAASVFNALSVNGSMTVDQVQAAMRVMGFDAERPAVESAVRALANRDMIDCSGELLASRYPGGWVMTSRDRTDGHGWLAWTMKHLRTGAIMPLTQLERVPR